MKLVLARTLACAAATGGLWVACVVGCATATDGEPPTAEARSIAGSSAPREPETAGRVPLRKHTSAGTLRPVGEWPQWMGPQGDGASDVGLLPRGVEVSLDVDWSRPVGKGHSSLTVFGGRVLTLEADTTDVWAVSLDVDDGKLAWRVPLSGPKKPEAGRIETPLSTPTTDGKRVFAIHPLGRLFALDAGDGAVLWSRDLAEEFGAALPSYGMSTSPVLEDDRLFVLVGGREGRNLMAFEPDSGKALMSVGHAKQGSYATPVLGVLSGERQVVVPAGDRLYGMVPKDGEVLWSHTGLPYPDRDPLLLPGGHVFLALQEYAAMLAVGGEPLTARELWRSEDLKNSYSPAVHHQGAIYGFGAGRLQCLDVANGETLWQQRLGDGSVIRVDDHLVVFGGGNGRLQLIEASREGYHEVEALVVFPSGGYSVTPPSFAAGRIFLRGAQEIAAVRLGF